MKAQVNFILTHNTSAVGKDYGSGSRTMLIVCDSAFVHSVPCLVKEEW